MNYHETKDGIVMDDGTEYYVCLDTIGLGQDNEIRGGFDNKISVDYSMLTEEQLNSDDDDIYELPKKHKVEIADFMIKRWTEFRRHINTGA